MFSNLDVLSMSTLNYLLEGVTVLTSDGGPAHGATVSLGGNSLFSRSAMSKLSRNNAHTSGGDPMRGRVNEKLPPSPLPTDFRGITVLDTTGWLSVHTSDLDLSSKTLQLEPYDEVQGILLADGTGRIEIEEPQALRSSVFPVAVDGRGQFSATSIPPGDYTLEIHIEESERQLGTNKKILVAQHRVPVTVPSPPSSEPVDLGKITVPTIPLEE